VTNLDRKDPITLHFFGDSWTAEQCELERFVQQGKFLHPTKSVPALVSEELKLSYINYSRSGSSQSEMIYYLSKAHMKPGDHAVFCLTAPSRRFYLDHDNHCNSSYVDSIKDAINDFHDSWISACTCYMFNSLCINANVKPWFFSTFNVSWSKDTHNNIWDQIPSNNWIIPKNQCVIATNFDPEWFGRFTEFKNTDFFDWLKTRNEQVKKYIYPCEQHPNMEGRKTIASIICNSLREFV